jgi:undecaprenyl diphosphate synthase
MANPLLKGFKGVLDRSSVEARLIAALDPARMPRHVAIIMDGNGRWAKQRGLARVEGHRAGIQAVKDSVEFAARLTIPVLTLYAFSSENWKRPRMEVNTLWDLLREYLKKELPTLQESEIRFDCIGRIQELPRAVQRELGRVRRNTASNSGMRLVLALSYSGRLELVDAMNRILEERVVGPISEEDIDKRLYTANLPDPDLLIRSSGELRISNFLLWQIAYSEIYVTDVLWPDFRGIHLLQAVSDFQKRERRFGGILSTAFEGG